MSGISAEAVSACAAALALGLSALSMFYLARQTKAAAEQTRAAAEQTRISNVVAAVSANDMVLRSLREIHILILERPGAREYFCADKPLPEGQEEREQIVTIAELLADVMSTGVHVHECVPGSTSAEPWADYCRQTLAVSPVLRDVIREHPMWWPDLEGFLPSEPAV